jgi:hypothetical protein
MKIKEEKRAENRQKLQEQQHLKRPSPSACPSATTILCYPAGLMLTM